MGRLLCFIVAVGMVMLAVAQDQQTDTQKQIRHSTTPSTSPASGKDMFLAYCAACHGKDAKGDGPAASALSVAPADFTGLTKKHGKYPAMKVTTVLTGQANLTAHGNTEMPVWEPIFSRMSQGHEGEEHRIANLNHYIESLQAK
jgi:mono/diheme cytochrome c family protein